MLRGLGATVALPFLDAMVPALSARSRTQWPKRLGFVYVPNGVIMDRWTPAAEGAGFEFTGILEPLAGISDQVLVVSGLAQANGRALGDGPGDHGRAGATFLTGVHPRKTEGANLRAGVSADQVGARFLGASTRLGSLEIGLERGALAGGCDSGYSCAYTNTISWRDPVTPLPFEINPRAVFDRLFGDEDGGAPSSQTARRREDRSLLDFIQKDVSRVQAKLGTGDRLKIDQYLDSVRDVERRLQSYEKRNSLLPVLERPAGIPASFKEHARLMIDLQILAYQADLTRVVTFMIGREGSERVYDSIGLSEGHHTLTHHQGDREKIDHVARINRLHVEIFAQLLKKLRDIPEGDANLLDHTVLLYGSSLSDGNTHQHDNLPILLAGGASGRGGHVRLPRETPMNNLLLTMLADAGVPVEHLGDSTGALAI
ncbi:MAG TPA: DUF1552 domain-containing protein [Bryobacteraceae bacterium]|nr:DUF1552 domain-containing protein [Bryobacteraceae bacterium]